jgi:hypothetical protein
VRFNEYFITIPNAAIISVATAMVEAVLAMMTMHVCSA